MLLGAIALHRVGFGLALILAFSVGLAATITADRPRRRAGPSRVLPPVASTARSSAALPAVSALVILAVGIGDHRQRPLRRLLRCSDSTTESLAFSDGGSVWIVRRRRGPARPPPRHRPRPPRRRDDARRRRPRARRPPRGELGLAWGLGHALTLFAFGLPILLLDGYLPERVQQGAETAVALVIVVLAVRLLVRWRRGAFHDTCTSRRSTTRTRTSGTATRHARGRLGAFGIGLVHGMGGSAGVGILLVASIESTALAVVSLALLAVFTAVSMAMLSTGFGRALVSRPVSARVRRRRPGARGREPRVRHLVRDGRVEPRSLSVLEPYDRGRPWPPPTSSPS